jgi:Arc/MetJ family transcription regulator
MTAMSRTNIDIDDGLIRRAMQVHGCKTKREAVDLALRKLVGDPMSIDEVLAMRGRGWGGDLDEIKRGEAEEYDQTWNR